MTIKTKKKTKWRKMSTWFLPWKMFLKWLYRYQKHIYLAEDFLNENQKKQVINWVLCEVFSHLKMRCFLIKKVNNCCIRWISIWWILRMVWISELNYFCFYLIKNISIMKGMQPFKSKLLIIIIDEEEIATLFKSQFCSVQHLNFFYHFS